MTRSVLVIAGEVSGDMHAAGLVRALRARGAPLAVWGIGGDRLREAGMEILYDARRMAVMGLWEVLRRYAFFRHVFDEMLARVEERRPDLAILVDYPGFNLRFARALHARGVKVVYYVCPQVWAWHRSRIREMARDVDRLLVIFPFEVEAFADTGLRTEYVGHPLVDETRTARAAPAQMLPWAGEPRVAILPGSRRQEIERILPALTQAAALLQHERPSASFLLPAPSAEIAEFARRVMAAQPARPERCGILVGQAREVLRQARAAWVTSGTATLEACLMGCPMAVVYRTAPLTYALAKRLVRVPHIGMVNLVAGRLVCPELIQGAATPRALAGALQPLLDEGDVRSRMLAGYAEVAARLGDGGAAERAAAAVAQELGIA